MAEDRNALVNALDNNNLRDTDRVFVNLDLNVHKYSRTQCKL